VRYTVINAKGLTASGSVTVPVSQDALRPPVAKDVFVRPADLAAGNPADATVDPTEPENG